MREAGGLDDLRIEASIRSLFGMFSQQFLRQPSSDLSNLDRVLLSRVEYVGLARPNDLGNTSEPMERRRVEKAIPVALELRALISSCSLVSPRLAVSLPPSQCAYAASASFTALRVQSLCTSIRPRSAAR